MTNQHNSIADCDQFNDALADYLERELPDSARAAMESHALSCGDCGALLADLRALRVDAANLPELAPSRDLWAGIAARIETPVVEIGARGGERAARRQRGAAWMGLAAAALVGVTATTTYVLTKRATTAAAPAAVVATAVPQPAATLGSPVQPDTAAAPVASEAGRRTATAPSAGGAPSPAVTQLVSNAKPSAEATYSTEIVRLRRIVNGRRAELDSSTVAVLERNLKIIDDAIAQCRQALQKDPASAYLNESLNDALDNKVRLLRAAAGLPAKM